MNLLEETKRAIDRADKGIKDIVYIGNPFNGEYLDCWSTFADLADKEYDNGYGGTEVNTALRIVFKDGSYLKRWEYDGSEGWEFVQLFDYEQCRKSMKDCVLWGY